MRPLPAALVLPLLLAGLVPALPAAPGPEGASFTSLWCPLLEGKPTGPLERCNVRASARSGPVNEIDLAMDPRDPDHLVVVGKGYNYTRLMDSALAGGVITPYATSFDGGLTWTEGYLQPLDQVQLTLPDGTPVGETTHHESDPIVEFAADGAVLAVTLRVNSDRGLPVYRSDDGGRTFAEVSKAYPGGTDKEWMVTDPHTGNVYVATLHQGGMGFMKSTDHGLTWSAPKRICSCVFPGIDVGPGGVVYAVGYGGGRIWFTRSTDEGATWSPQVPIADHNGVVWNTGNMRLFRTPNIPQIAASRTSDDVYVVWAAQPLGTQNPPCEVRLPQVLNPGGGCPTTPNHDIFLLASHDGGATWSPAQRINDDPPLDTSFQFMAQVAVSPRGDVHVAWLDQRHDPTGLTAVAYYAHSRDGRAWDPNLLVSDMPFLTTLAHHQSLSNLAFVGDYIGLQATDDKAVIAFPDTRYGRSDTFIAVVR